MGFNSTRTGLYLAFLAAATLAAGCSDKKKKRNFASTVAPSQSSATPNPGVAPVPSSSTGPVATSTTPLPPGPLLLSATFQDTDGDERVGKGDKIVCAFAADMEAPAAGADPQVELDLAVAKDSFGAGASLERGTKPSEIHVVLGDAPRLRISGGFGPAKLNEGSASGLNLRLGASLKGQNTDVARPAVDALDIGGTLQAKFHTAATLIVPRGGHSAVTLDDGRVLVVGGLRGRKRGDLVDEAELYDPLADAFVKVSALSGEKGYMKRGRNKVKFFMGTAVKLKDGTVLICGGFGTERRGFLGLGKGKLDTLESAFLFRPVDSSFERVGDMKYSRHSHTATLMADGRVLIAGGYNESFWRRHKTQAPLEVYDPSKKKFSKLGKVFRRAKLKTPRMSHTAVAIDNGNSVLFAGGIHYKGGGLFGWIKPKLQMVKTAEILQGEKVKSAKALNDARLAHAAIGFGRNEVLVAGGHTLKGGPVKALEVFSGGQWKRAGNLRLPRSGCEIARHRNLALIVGGHTGAGETSTVEVFDLDAKRLQTTRLRMKTGRNGCTVSQLKDGRVLVIGGMTGGKRDWRSIDGQPLASCEVFVSN